MSTHVQQLTTDAYLASRAPHDLLLGVRQVGFELLYLGLEEMLPLEQLGLDSISLL